MQKGNKFAPLFCVLCTAHFFHFLPNAVCLCNNALFSISQPPFFQGDHFTQRERDSFSQYQNFYFNF